MKPIIVYIESDNSDKIIISRTDLEKYINDAYEQGWSEAYKRSVPDYVPISIPYAPNPPWYPTVTYTSVDTTSGNSRPILK
jgi:hypothetical protein